MQNSKFYIYLLGLLFILTLNTCSNDDFGHPVVEDKLYEEVLAHFQLQLGESTSLRSDPDFLNGTTAENKISSLTFFVIDLDGSNDLDWTRIKYAYVSAPVNPTTTPIEFSIKTGTGKKRVYVGANMSFDQIHSFCTKKGKYTSPGNTYDEVIRDFVDLGNRGIVMFGQVKMKDAPHSPTIEVLGDDVIETKAVLERVVAKVALTYTRNTEPGVNHAIITDGIGGFIDADSIRFMLNATSKSIDFVQSSRYYNMSDYIATNGGEAVYHYIKNPIPNFMLYTPGGIPGKPEESIVYATATIKLPIEILPGEDDPYHLPLGLVELDPNPTPNPNWHDYSSLYCLENTVNSSGFELAPELEELRRGVNTHVVVAAKYVPDAIYHIKVEGKDTTLIQKSITTHGQLLDITNNSADPNGHYTFYAVLIAAATPSTPALYDYYTYDAKQFKEKGDATLPFITYKGGYGYYTTLITQDKPMDEDGHYDLIRNNYYILNAEKFTPPGAVYPQQLYMLINSQTVEWKNQEAKEILLD